MHMTHGLAALILVAFTVMGVSHVGADVITDANARAADIASKAPGTPPAVRVMAFVQVSVFEAVNAITARYPSLQAKIHAPTGASIDAAVAAATRTALVKLMPSQQAAIDADYDRALKLVPDGPAKSNGIAVGEQAAAACLARVDEASSFPDSYRPYTTPGAYVPTTLPAVPDWGKRKPWVMASSAQFRPGPPPALTSAIWARDYNEIKAIGSKNSAQRTAEQTALAKFWEATAPAVYWPVARSVAAVPGREVTANARLMAIAGMAMDDAL
ncbi:MAG TPA: PA-phosphatase, partial [Methylomirabilota bacterium]